MLDFSLLLNAFARTSLVGAKPGFYLSSKPRVWVVYYDFMNHARGFEV